MPSEFPNISSIAHAFSQTFQSLHRHITNASSWLLLSTSIQAVLFQAPSKEDRLANAQTAANVLIKWYSHTSGLWNTTGWWNSANVLTTLANLEQLKESSSYNFSSIADNTFVRAPTSNTAVLKTLDAASLPCTHYWPALPPEFALSDLHRPHGFLNGYYDDEGWWALAWIQTYRVTRNPKYLDEAENIFLNMEQGWTTPCGGGIWWNKDRTYVNAIANELFMSVAAHLANDVPRLHDHYVEWAEKAWSWFVRSGMINSHNTINDGLKYVNGHCFNNNRTVWSYNQGVVLGGLVELAHATQNTSYVTIAQNIANAAIMSLTNASTGTLRDVCEPSKCGADGSQFKGIFLRNLQILQRETGQKNLTDFILRNADNIWNRDRDRLDELSLVWSGPFVKPANASTQSSALDALVAAAAVA
jgi:predicted alpha-1,6-mannanase (GH76 family)